MHLIQYVYQSELMMTNQDLHYRPQTMPGFFRHLCKSSDHLGDFLNELLLKIVILHLSPFF